MTNENSDAVDMAQMVLLKVVSSDSRVNDKAKEGMREILDNSFQYNYSDDNKERLILVNDSDSFAMYMDVLNGDDFEGIQPPSRISKTTHMYGILSEGFGWVKEIYINTLTEELKVTFTNNKLQALAIEGCILNGRILTWGSCQFLK